MQVQKRQDQICPRVCGLKICKKMCLRIYIEQSTTGVFNVAILKEKIWKKKKHLQRNRSSLASIIVSILFYNPKSNIIYRTLFLLFLYSCLITQLRPVFTSPAVRVPCFHNTLMVHARQNKEPSHVPALWVRKHVAPHAFSKNIFNTVNLWTHYPSST